MVSVMFGQIDVASQHPDVVKRLLGELGAFSWECPDHLCTVDSFNGTADICASLAAYGSFGPFAGLPPPPPSPPMVGAVSFEQGAECLVLKGKGLVLGDCNTTGAQWALHYTRNILDPELGQQQVPTLASALEPDRCLHLNHHDKNNTCDGTPSSNHPVLGSCSHGNAFNFTRIDGDTGKIEILMCPNWGAAGACLVSHRSSAVGLTRTSTVEAGACDGVGALWTKVKAP